MFQTLRANSPIYVLHKDTVSIEIGYIKSISLPKPKYSVPASFNTPQELVIDMVVGIGNNIYNYNGLPANLDIADSISNGECIVISGSKEAMNAEILNLKNKSEEIIKSVKEHKNKLINYDKILTELNPEFAEKQQQRLEIEDLKKQMAELLEYIKNKT